MSIARVTVIVIAAGFALSAHGSPPPPYYKHDAWDRAVDAAAADLEACNQLGVTARVSTSAVAEG